MLFYTHSLILLQSSVLWLSTVTINNDAKSPPKWILREFDVSRIRPRLGGLPHLEIFTCQNLTPAERLTRSGRPGYPPQAGHPTCHVNVIKLKWEIIWTGGLPQLPGVPHLQENRPLVSWLHIMSRIHAQSNPIARTYFKFLLSTLTTSTNWDLEICEL